MFIKKDKNVLPFKYVSACAVRYFSIMHHDVIISKFGMCEIFCISSGPNLL